VEHCADIAGSAVDAKYVNSDGLQCLLRPGFMMRLSEVVAQGLLASELGRLLNPCSRSILLM